MRGGLPQPVAFVPLTPSPQSSLSAKIAVMNTEGRGTAVEAYIDLLSHVLLLGRYALTDEDLRRIGRFTRGNVLRFILERDLASVGEGYGLRDFHAVCGDVEIPWEDPSSQSVFDERQALP